MHLSCSSQRAALQPAAQRKLTCTLFRLTMSGADAQVETAKALLRTVIQGA